MLTGALLTVPASHSTLIWGLRLLPLLLFVVALGLLVAFYFYPTGVKESLGRLLGLFSRRLARFTTGVLERFHAGLAALPDPRSFWAFVGLSAGYWIINGLAFFFLARACGLMLPLAGAVAGMGCLAVGILLPAGPGYFGNFQAAVVAAIEIFLPVAAVSERLAVFVFLLYVLQTGLTVVFGGFGALRLRSRPILHRPSTTLVSPDSRP
jgi:glycosyltransferase 2 family protein